jgi:hypothetical protein
MITRCREQVSGFNIEHVGELFDRVEGGGINLPLERRDIGPVDRGEVSERLLRQVLSPSRATKVFRKDLAQPRGREEATSLTLHPRSILYILRPSFPRGGLL